MIIIMIVMIIHVINNAMTTLEIGDLNEDERPWIIMKRM